MIVQLAEISHVATTFTPQVQQFLQFAPCSLDLIDDFGAKRHMRINHVTMIFYSSNATVSRMYDSNDRQNRRFWARVALINQQYDYDFRSINETISQRHGSIGRRSRQFWTKKNAHKIQ